MKKFNVELTNKQADRINWIRAVVGVIIFGILAINSVSAFDWTNGTVGYYKLDETFGTIVNDTTGIFNGSSYRALVNQTGLINTAYFFNGTTGYANLTNNFTLARIRTYQVWFKTTNNSIEYAGILNTHAGSYERGISILNTTYLYVDRSEQSGDGGFYFNASDYASGTWHQVIVVENATGGVVYYDGAMKRYNANAIVNFSTFGTYNVTIGSRGNFALTRYFNGSIDEVGFWNRTLTQSEITDLYNGGAGLVYGGSGIENISTCRPLNISGRIYNVTSNITTTGSCFNTSASGITLNCNGFTLTGKNLTSSYGVRITQPDTTINDCIFLNFSKGVFVDGTANTKISNVIANTTRNGGFGILLAYESSYSIITNSTGISNSGPGIHIENNSNYNNIINSTGISNSGHGIRIKNNSNYNNIINSTGISNSGPGILIENSSYNNITNSNATSIFYQAIRFAQSSNNIIKNSTINGSIGLNISSDSNHNAFFYNNFIRAAIYIINLNETNQFNTTVNSIAQGNYYENILDLYIFDSNGDGFGDNGYQYPYNATYSGGKWTGYGNDYGPMDVRSITENSQTFNSTTYEVSYENFSINMTYDLNYFTSVTAKLVYNGTNYSGISGTDGNNVIFSKAITIPIVNEPTNYSFYWNFIFTNLIGQSTSVNSTLYNQTVNLLIFQICNATYNVSAINFTFIDEKKLTVLNGSFSATFHYWIGSGEFGIYKNYSFSNINNNLSLFSFCISPSNYIYKTDMDAEYSALDFLSRTYYLNNATLTNSSQLISLYLINESEGIKFFMTLTSNLASIDDATVIINKYDTGSGNYKTIGIRETDISGKFIEYFELDKNYQFSISKNGAFLGTLEKTAICAASPCEIPLEISTIASNFWQGYFDIFASNVVYNLTFNRTSKIITYSFTDLTGLAQYFRLVVVQTRFNQSGIEIFNETQYLTSGTITANLSAYSGDFIATGYVSRSPQKDVSYIAIKIFDTIKEVLKTEGLFWTFLLILTVVLVGIWNPVVAIVLAVATLFVASIIGFVEISYIAIVLIVILAAIIIIKMGRNV